MGKGGAVEIKTKRVRRARLHVLQPEKAGIVVDETADQPGRSHTIHPEPRACGPLTALIVLRVKARHRATGRFWLVRGELAGQATLGFSECPTSNLQVLAVEEVNGRDSVELLAQLP